LNINVFKEDHIILRKKVIIGLNYWFDCTYHFQETFMLPKVNVDILFTFKTIRMLLYLMLLYCIKQIFLAEYHILPLQV